MQGESMKLRYRRLDPFIVLVAFDFQFAGWDYTITNQMRDLDVLKLEDAA